MSSNSKSINIDKDMKIEIEPTPEKVETRQEGAKHIPEQNQVNKATN